MKRYNQTQFFSIDNVKDVISVGMKQYGYMCILWPVLRRDIQNRIRQCITM